MPSPTSAAPQTGVQTGFTSILFETEVPAARGSEVPEPGCFADLNLDQLVSSVLAHRAGYDLAPLFRRPLTSTQEVLYRQEVMRDLERPPIRKAVRSFAAGMNATRDHLARADKFGYEVQQQAAVLRAATTYVEAVDGLAAAFRCSRPHSRGLGSFADDLEEYARSQAFTTLSSQAAAVREALGRVTYRLHLPGGRVDVSRVGEEEDYAADVTQTFARFRQGDVESHRAKLPVDAEMNHVEAAIAGLVARLYPEEFAALRTFWERHVDFLDSRVQSFDREAQFCLAWLEFGDRLGAAGLPMCYPEVSGPDAPLLLVDAFDPTLADHLQGQGMPTVFNDVRCEGKERILVVTGPNQGGKTTFARMVGELTYLASLGLPVPGRRATVPLPDMILTHFEHGENLADLRGALEDDLVRVREMLRTATSRSLLILNEVFTSTSLHDAVWLSTRVLRQVADLGCRCVCVTFLDELATVTDTTVSLVAQVDPADPATRTFKVIRQPANGEAYAEAIARKHALDRASLTARLPR